MIEVYKILTNKYDSNVNLNLQQSQNSITRGHNLKLVNSRCSGGSRICWLGGKGWPPLSCAGGGQVLLLFDSLLAQKKTLKTWSELTIFCTCALNNTIYNRYNVQLSHQQQTSQCKVSFLLWCRASNSSTKALKSMACARADSTDSTPRLLSRLSHMLLLR